MLSLIFTAVIFFTVAATLSALYLEEKIESGDVIPVELENTRWENVLAILKDEVKTLYRVTRNKVS